MAKFRKGQSGNPKGRPKGSKDRRNQYRELFESNAPELVAKAIEMALAGDNQAMRLCVERFAPAVRSVDVPVSIPGWDIAANSGDQSRLLLSAVATGVLGPDQGSRLLAALASQVQIEKFDELFRRIAELERDSETGGQSHGR